MIIGKQIELCSSSNRSWDIIKKSENRHLKSVSNLALFKFYDIENSGIDIKIWQNASNRSPVYLIDIKNKKYA